MMLIDLGALRKEAALQALAELRQDFSHNIEILEQLDKIALEFV